MCIKGFIYCFMYVRVREKMTGKVIRHPDSVFDGLPNRCFIVDFGAILKENRKMVIMRNTRKAANKEQHWFTPKNLLQ